MLDRRPTPPHAACMHVSRIQPTEFAPPTTPPTSHVTLSAQTANIAIPGRQLIRRRRTRGPPGPARQRGRPEPVVVPATARGQRRPGRPAPRAAARRGLRAGVLGRQGRDRAGRQGVVRAPLLGPRRAAPRRRAGPVSQGGGPGRDEPAVQDGDVPEHRGHGILQVSDICRLAGAAPRSAARCEPAVLTCFAPARFGSKCIFAHSEQERKSQSVDDMLKEERLCRPCPIHIMTGNWYVPSSLFIWADF